jgi:hypothetical protein
MLVRRLGGEGVDHMLVEERRIAMREGIAAQLVVCLLI